MGWACSGCYCLVVTELQHQVTSWAEPLLQGTVLGVCAIQLTQEERDLSLCSPPFRGNCWRVADPLCSVLSWGMLYACCGVGSC